MGKDLVGSGGGLIEILSQHISRETQEIHEKPQSGLDLPQPILEPSTSE
jgi:hypothetical protein